MKKISTLLFVAIIFASCWSNPHLRYVNGAVVAESRSYTGVSVLVDTSGDGVADLEAGLLGSSMARRYKRGDSMSIDVRKSGYTADPILK